MGLLPQLRSSPFKVHHATAEQDKNSPFKPHKWSSGKGKAALPVTPLPQEVQELKDKILAANQSKLVRFSLSHMRHIATPPVKLPENVANPRATTVIVAGHKVPFTKCMHGNAKKKFTKRQMNMIDEHVQY
ncbi:hypothetical protein FI667_g3337, partial [Globisporangium splendens]